MTHPDVIVPRVWLFGYNRQCGPLMSLRWRSSNSCHLVRRGRFTFKWRTGENPKWMSGSHLCISRNETVQPPYFQNRIIIFSLPIPTLTYLWEIYVFPGSVCLFCSQICWLILGIYKSLTDQINVEIGTKAAQFPEKEYTIGIFVAV